MKCLHHIKIFMLLLDFLKSVESKTVMLFFYLQSSFHLDMRRNFHTAAVLLTSFVVDDSGYIKCMFLFYSTKRTTKFLILVPPVPKSSCV